MTKRAEIEPVRAAGGVVYRQSGSGREILLIQRNGFWDLPKGKLEDGESLPECAIREVKEETGVKNLSIQSFLCETYHEYEQKRRRFGKTTYWYFMKSGDEPSDLDLVPQTEEGITSLDWVAEEEAVNRAHFSNLKTVLRQLSGF